MMLETTRDKDVFTSDWFTAMLPNAHYLTLPGRVSVHARRDCPDVDAAQLTGASRLPRGQRVTGCVVCQSAMVIKVADELAGEVRVFRENLRCVQHDFEDRISYARRELDIAWADAGEYLPHRFMDACERHLEHAPGEIGATSLEQVLSLLRAWADQRAADRLAELPILQPDGVTRAHPVLLGGSMLSGYDVALDRDLGVQSPEHVLTGPNGRPTFVVRLSEDGLRDLRRVAAFRQRGFSYARITEASTGHLRDERVRRIVEELLSSTEVAAGASIDKLLETALAVLREPSSDSPPTVPSVA